MKERKEHVPSIKIKDEVLECGWKEVRNLLPKNWVDKSIQKQELNGVYKHIYDALGLCRINEKEAKAYTLNIYLNQKTIRPKKYKWGWNLDCKMDGATYWAWITAIESFNYTNTVAEERMHPDFIKTGRVFSALTFLPTPLRQFVTINGKPLVELDIRNSQPLIFASILKSNLAKYNLDRHEVEIFTHLCQEGKFYDYVSQLIQDTGENIADGVFKIDFFAKIFFSTERRKYKWRKIFDARFPSIGRTISEMKSGDHSKLSIALQKQESEIMIQGAFTSIYDQGISEAVPLHDACYTTSDNAFKCNAALQKAFKNHGIIPKIRMDSVREKPH
jgi:hypothetical protein